MIFLFLFLFFFLPEQIWIPVVSITSLNLFKDSSWLSFKSTGGEGGIELLWKVWRSKMWPLYSSCKGQKVFLLSLWLCFSVYMCVLVAKSCLTLCDPMDCGPPGSSVHGILQARILEWVAISFSRGSSQLRDQIPRSPALQADYLPSEPPGKPFIVATYLKIKSSQVSITAVQNMGNGGWVALKHP